MENMKQIKQHSNEYKTWIYSPEWREKSNKCLKLFKNRCVLFPWLQATHTHHLTYRNMKKELPVRDVVPLSKKAHELVHIDKLWKDKNVCKYVNAYLRIASVLVFVFNIFSGSKSVYKHKR